MSQRSKSVRVCQLVNIPSLYNLEIPLSFGCLFVVVLPHYYLMHCSLQNDVVLWTCLVWFVFSLNKQWFNYSFNHLTYISMERGKSDAVEWQTSRSNRIRIYSNLQQNATNVRIHNEIGCSVYAKKKNPAWLRFHPRQTTQWHVVLTWNTFNIQLS